MKHQLENMRTTKAFDEICSSTSEEAKRLDLDDLAIPIKRRPPGKYSGAAEAYTTLLLSKNTVACCFSVNN